MLASILQLTGAIVLGYYIAFRSKVKSRQAASVIIPTKGKKNEKYLDLYTETYAFRIGFVFVVVGYLIQIAEFDLPVFQSLDIMLRLSISLISTTLFTLLSVGSAKLLGKRLFNKEGTFNADGNDHVPGQVVFFSVDDE